MSKVTISDELLWFTKNFDKQKSISVTAVIYQIEIHFWGAHDKKISACHRGVYIFGDNIGQNGSYVRKYQIEIHMKYSFHK